MARGGRLDENVDSDVTVVGFAPSLLRDRAGKSAATENTCRVNRFPCMALYVLEEAAYSECYIVSPSFLASRIVLW